MFKKIQTPKTESSRTKETFSGRFESFLGRERISSVNSPYLMRGRRKIFFFQPAANPKPKKTAQMMMNPLRPRD